jgi:hypothetical protein
MDSGTTHGQLCGRQPMICACCDQPIRDDEEYTTESIPGATNAGADIVLHAQPCKRTLQPTSPSGLGR